MSLLNHIVPEDLYDFRDDVVVVINKTWETLTTEEQTLLYKILTSVKLDPGSVRIITQSKLDLSALENYSPSRILVFGADADQEIPYHKPTAAQGFSVLRTDDLSNFDDARKKELWTALRTMFNRN